VEIGAPCLIPDFRGNGYSFSHFKCNVDYKFVIYSLNYIEVHLFYS
jgi:hypothetical protein